MMKFCSSITLESIVLVEGEIKPVEIEIEATTIKHFEVHISKVGLPHTVI
jgi:aspartyl/asparaginyl-tRNA synthetase